MTLQLHVPTLLVVSLIVNLTLSCFCVMSWYGRNDRQIYVWLSVSGFSFLLGSFFLLMRDNTPEWAGIWLAQSLLMIGSGLLWTSMRVFEGRPPLKLWAFAGAGIWTVFCLIQPLYSEQANRVVCASLITAGYYGCLTWELQRGYRNEPLRSRLIACSLTALHTLACLARLMLVYSADVSVWPSEQASNTIGVFVIETIVVLVGVVLTLTTMERDRAELEQRKAASTDVLTGAMNRRAFLDNANSWIERKGKDAALLLFDLDHFKKINDTFGHAGGDAALVGFAKLVSRRIEIANIIAGFNLDAATSNQYPRWYEATLADAAEGGEPIFGRLGGEEFACMLPHLSLPQGIAIAEDIRRELETLDIFMGSQRIPMSVSASVVTTADIGHRLNMMLTSADHALYRAKNRGRNRVEVGVSEPGMVIRHYA
jgi:GGDEF domain-containing protein